MRFPDVHDPQSEAKTREILSEIDRINHQLGYVKKQPRTPMIVRPPVESYFFPRDRRHFSPSALAAHGQSSSPRSIPMQNYLIVPLPFELSEAAEVLPIDRAREARKYSDFAKIDYYKQLYKSPYWNNKVQEEPKEEFNLENIEPPLITFPKDNNNNNNNHETLRNNFTFSLPPITIPSTTTTTTGTSTVTTAKPKDKDPDLIDAIIDEVVDDDDDTSEDDDEEEEEDDYEDEDTTTTAKKRKQNTETQNISINKYINNLYKNSLITIPKSQGPQQNKSTTVLSLLGPSTKHDQLPQPSTERTRIFNPVKRIQEIKRRKHQQELEALLAQEQQQLQHQQKQEQEKAPFGFFRPAETALKEGGIVIQRLRVRQGGISIAGAGGVATSGSGGTSIVGPGGIALSHPRSLSVVGPGARVVSVPANIDLGEIVKQLTKGRSLPFIEGAKVVATGPAIYYNTGDR